VNTGEILLTIDLEAPHKGPFINGNTIFFTSVHKILQFLAQKNLKATFFVVASIAQQFPDLIHNLLRDGHEIGLHTYNHNRLDTFNPHSFEKDTKLGLKILHDIGVKHVYGFRAPYFSLKPQTHWAIDILHELGFVYDSSVLPAWFPPFGRPTQFQYIHQYPNGLWSVPITVFRLIKSFGIPAAGGAYLRLLPELFSHWAAHRYHIIGEPVCIYFHPYDIDPQVPIGTPFGKNLFFNTALRLRRHDMLNRINRLITGKKVSRIIDHLRSRLHISRDMDSP